MHFIFLGECRVQVVHLHSCSGQGDVQNADIHGSYAGGCLLMLSGEPLSTNH